jgi:uncharacterized repeat protein (TIGR01451 family)
LHANFGDAAAFASAPRRRSTARRHTSIEAGFDRQANRDHRRTRGLCEILDKSNKPVMSTTGEVLTVRLLHSQPAQEWISNVALIDLLPGGFEVVSSSLTPGSRGSKASITSRSGKIARSSTRPSDETLEITYQIKSCNRGNFVVPPVFAESMYDRSVKGRGLGGKISVTK